MKDVPVISLKIYNANPKIKVSNEAVFIVPYNNGENIAAYFGGIAGFLKLCKEGVYNSGYASLLWDLKNIEVASKLDLKNQVEGYLSLIKMTNNNKQKQQQPVSVVLVKNQHDLPLEVAIECALASYRDIFKSNSKEFLKELKGYISSQIIKTDKFKKLHHDNTATIYYSLGYESGSGLLEKLFKTTHGPDAKHQEFMSV